jgi:hypothetical protein
LETLIEKSGTALCSAAGSATGHLLSAQQVVVRSSAQTIALNPAGVPRLSMRVSNEARTVESQSLCTYGGRRELTNYRR